MYQKTDIKPNLVASFFGVNGKISMPMSDKEIARCESFFSRVIRIENINRGKKGLMISTLSECAAIMPFERALINQGLVLTGSEANPWDGARTEATIRRFDVAIIAPVSNIALEAIKLAGFDPKTLFKGKIVYAKPDAYDQLKGAEDIDLRLWLEIGPMVALQPKDCDYLVYDAREWIVKSQGDKTILSSRLDRAMLFKDESFDISIQIDENIKSSIIGTQAIKIKA